MATRMAGFKAERGKKLIKKSEVVRNGKVDYKKLVVKVNELGDRLFKESRLLERF